MSLEFFNPLTEEEQKIAIQKISDLEQEVETLQIEVETLHKKLESLEKENRHNKEAAKAAKVHVQILEKVRETDKFHHLQQYNQALQLNQQTAWLASQSLIKQSKEIDPPPRRLKRARGKNNHCTYCLKVGVEVAFTKEHLASCPNKK